MATVVQSWAWVITATDSDSARLAGQYIDAAMESPQLSQWLSANYYLPLGRQVAIAAGNADGGADYSEFIAQLLEAAVVPPDMRYYPGQQTILGEMIASVLSGETAPERAAVTAATAISSLR